MSEEQAEYLEEEKEPLPAMTEEERQLAVEKKMEAYKQQRRRSPAAKKKRSAPIKKDPPNTPQDAYNIEVPAERKMNQPWRPASILTARKKEGMRSRWVRKDLLEKRIEEGWFPRISHAKSRIEASESTMIDGKPLSSYVVKRNLILCDMPEEMAKSREAYFKSLADSGLEAQKNEFKNQTNIGGASYAYGDVKTER